jgi:large subunit ribosomal protein L4
MPELDIKDKNNTVVAKIVLSDDLFGISAKQGVLHEAVVNYLANQRQGTHATKTKGLISGGGKKPWKQKGTGRARSGSTRSPLWRGGGTIFGPQPRDYSYKLPKKVKRLALMNAFHEKLSSGEVIILDGFSMEKPRTKDVVAILKNLDLQNKSVLIILPEKDDAVVLSARNIPGVNVVRAADVNVYDVITHAKLLMTKDAVLKLGEIKGS